MKTIILFFLSFTSIIFSQSVSNESHRKSVSITVYESFAHIKESRVAILPRGISILKYEDVSTEILPASVRVSSVSNPDIKALEQNYRYDVINKNSILNQYLGKEIILIRHHPQTGDLPPIKIQLLSFEEKLMYKLNNEIYIDNEYEPKFVFPNLNENIFIRPTLLWKISNEGKEEFDLDVSYQTEKFSWSADYNLNLREDEKKGDVQCWVSLTNNSGASYKNANLQLVAGNVKRFLKEDMPKNWVADAPTLPPGYKGVDYNNEKYYKFEQENLADYYLYNLDTKIDIADKELKQVQLFSARDIKIDKTYLIKADYIAALNDYKPEVEYSIKNKKENSLGRPLPKGVFHLYKSDSRGLQQFIGEDKMEHTPDNEEIKIVSGNAFDIVVNGREVFKKEIGKKKGFQAKHEIKIRNGKKESSKIKFYHRQEFGTTRFIETSHKFKKEKTRYFTELTLKPSEEAKIEYTHEVIWYTGSE
ncbi:MAG TPA: DUF4139 domain-containing protein [Leptospiraceae bacterium]|nr:DUF4139 domain-containing protein [Leptospiraceae bacterium]